MQNYQILKAGISTLIYHDSYRSKGGLCFEWNPLEQWKLWNFGRKLSMKKKKILIKNFVLKVFFWMCQIAWLTESASPILKRKMFRFALKTDDKNWTKINSCSNSTFRLFQASIFIRIYQKMRSFSKKLLTVMCHLGNKE